MKRVLLSAIAALGFLNTSQAHNPGAYLNWNREISRVFYARCADCHRQGGTAFSLMTYAEVQPHLNEIKDQVLGRKMPPWGAVKGFGDFRNDQGLTQEEIELIAAWIDQGASRGNNPNILPPIPKITKPAKFAIPKGSIELAGDVTLTRPFILDGLYPQKMGNAKTARLFARFPDGHLEPLLWLYEYKEGIAHPFLFRNPMEFPTGTSVYGIPEGGSVLLLPGRKK